MERLCIRAGKRALEMIRDGGFSLDRVTTYVGPAVGPRWLVASGFDLTLLRNGKLGSKSRPVLLTGASAGAWRFAAWLQPEPEKSYRRLLDAYIGIPCDRRSTPSSLRRSLQEVINAYLEDDAIPFALAHDHYRLAVTTARAKNLAASETPWVQKWGLALCYALNRINRGHLFRFFERVVFYSGPRPPQFCLRPGFRGKAVVLNEFNFKHAVLASGAIPLLIEGVTDIYGAPRGIYRDGGMIDYHLDHDYAVKEDDVTLLFHHEDRIIPGWLDKKIKGRRPSGRGPRQPPGDHPVARARGNLPRREDPRPGRLRDIHRRSRRPHPELAKGRRDLRPPRGGVHRECGKREDPRDRRAVEP